MQRVAAAQGRVTSVDKAGSRIEGWRRNRLPVHPFVSPNRRFETAATCLDCCLSQEILDGGNGSLTT